jgi:hypothetical protein
MKPIPAIDERYRSLLQKAVRRGHVDLVVTVGAFLEDAVDPPWLERRVEWIVIGECWPLSSELGPVRVPHARAAALVRAAQVRKDRDAAGMGLLAYALASDDRGVPAELGEERDLRLLSQAVRRPAKFWEWVDGRPAGEDSRRVIAHARRCAAAVDRPHDQAMAMAAAYLALHAVPAEIPAAPPVPGPFPFWAVFDRHTAAGRRALRDVSRDLHIPARQLEWCGYYYESARANADAPSLWWRRYCAWCFARHGLSPEEAPLLWAPARRQLAEALAPDAHALQAELYEWKLAHREQVAALREQVDFFLEQLRDLPRRQPQLF